MLATRFGARFAHSVSNSAAKASAAAGKRSEDTIADVVADLSNRLQPYRLNKEQKRLVYRTRGQKVLERSLRPRTDNNGNPLVPNKWKGMPSKAGLTHLIARIKEPEHFEEAKKWMNDYATYVPELLRINHFSDLLRNSAAIGLYDEAYTYLHSRRFVSQHAKATEAENLLWTLEVMRLSTARALERSKVNVSHRGDKHRREQLQKLASGPHSDDPQVALLNLAGQAVLGADQAQIKTALDKAIAAVDMLSPASIESTKGAQLVKRIADFRIALEGVKSIDDPLAAQLSEKVTSLLNAAGDRPKHFEQSVDRFVALIQAAASKTIEPVIHTEKEPEAKEPEAKESEAQGEAEPETPGEPESK